MSQQSAIEWCDTTWNPVTGCDRVSPGCAHCYALDLAAKLKRWGQPRYQNDGGRSSGPGFGVTLHPDKLGEPLRWRRPRMVFVNSMSDLFHEEIPNDFIARVFAVMAAAPQHTFQVLTKRPDRMREWVTRVSECEDGWLTHNGDNPSSYGGSGIIIPRGGHLDGRWPLPNVWLGVSIENRRFVHRADLLRATPAAVRFISAEPLLGPLIGDLTGPGYPGRDHLWMDDYPGDGLDLTDIDWLIIGGESGSHHRRFDPEWARDLIDACRQTGTAPFVKQLGGARPGNRLEDLPPDLQVREWPRQAVSA